MAYGSGYAGGYAALVAVISTEVAGGVQSWRIGRDRRKSRRYGQYWKES